MPEDGDQRYRVLAVVFRLIGMVQVLGLAGIVLVAIYFITEAVVALAGQETTLNIDFSLSVQLYVLPYGGMALTTWLWLRERRLRKTTVNREARRSAALELKIDAGRTSSGLNEVGGEEEEDS